MPSLPAPIVTFPRELRPLDDLKLEGMLLLLRHCHSHPELQRIYTYLSGLYRLNRIHSDLVITLQWRPFGVTL